MHRCQWKRSAPSSTGRRGLFDPIDEFGYATGDARLIGAGAADAPRNDAGQHPAAGSEDHHWSTAVTLRPSLPSQ